MYFCKQTKKGVHFVKAAYVKHQLVNVFSVSKIVTIHYQALTEHYSAKEEKHDFWEMIYSDKEELFIVKDGFSTPLSAGQIAFIKPNQKHYVICGNKEPNIFIILFIC